MIDITKAEHVEIQTDLENNKLWVNVDGECVLRIYNIENLHKNGLAKATQLPFEYIDAEAAAAMLNLTKKTFLNLSQRGDIKGQTVYEGKRVWVRKDIEDTVEFLKESF